MLVGLTYDLRSEYLAQGYSLEQTAEFDKIDTINSIDNALTRLGYETLRIGNIKQLVSFLHSGKSCDLVFNIAEGMFGLAREAQVPALLDAYEIPYVFSDALVLAAALHKGIAKTIVRAHGVPTADFLVIENVSDLKNITIPAPWFIKPAGGGTGIGINASSMVHNLSDLQIRAGRLLHEYGQPVLAESFLAGPEYTVGIVGTGNAARSIGVLTVEVVSEADQGVYSYQSKQDYKDSVKYTLSVDPRITEACNETALSAWRALGCRDGGRVDLKYDNNGQVNFLEVNPLAGLHPIDSDLPIICNQQGMEYVELIKSIMDSAVSRIPQTVCT
ncbi:MAG: D-alanine--D-alanine ligase [Candidatus Margulisiibacteriota bacterium]